MSQFKLGAKDFYKVYCWHIRIEEDFIKHVVESQPMEKTPQPSMERDLWPVSKKEESSKIMPRP